MTIIWCRDGSCKTLAQAALDGDLRVEISGHEGQEPSMTVTEPPQGSLVVHDGAQGALRVEVVNNGYPTTELVLITLILVIAIIEMFIRPR